MIRSKARAFAVEEGIARIAKEEALPETAPHIARRERLGNGAAQVSAMGGEGPQLLGEESIKLGAQALAEDGGHAFGSNCHHHRVTINDRRHDETRKFRMIDHIDRNATRPSCFDHCHVGLRLRNNNEGDTFQMTFFETDGLSG